MFAQGRRQIGHLLKTRDSLFPNPLLKLSDTVAFLFPKLRQGSGKLLVIETEEGGKLRHVCSRSNGTGKSEQGINVGVYVKGT